MVPPEPQTPPGDSEREPMSLAEEIAAEVKDGVDITDRYESLKKGDSQVAALQKLSMQELVELARQEHLGDVTGVKKSDLVFRILNRRIWLGET